MNQQDQVNPIDYKHRTDSHHRAIIEFDPLTLLTCMSENIVLRINVRKKPTAILPNESMIDIPVIRVNRTLMDGNGTCTVTQRADSYGDTTSVLVYIGRQDVEGVRNVEMELIMSHSFEIESIEITLGGGRGWMTLRPDKEYFVVKTFNLFSVAAIKNVTPVTVPDFSTVSLMVTGDRDLNDIFVDTDKLYGVELSYSDYVDDNGNEKRFYVIFMYYQSMSLDIDKSGNYIIPHLDIYHKGKIDSVLEIKPSMK